MPIAFRILAMIAISAAAAAPPLAITPSNSREIAPPSIAEGRGVKRIQAINVNPKALGDESALRFSRQSVKKSRRVLEQDLRLFTDVTLRIRWSKAEKNKEGWTWTGSVVHFENSHAVLLSSPLGWTGNISRGDGTIFQIRSVATSSVWVREVIQRCQVLPRSVGCSKAGEVDSM